MTKPLPRTDETLYPYRGHIGFKKYNPQKPAKYGLLYRSLCDSTVTYTYFSLAYAGKPEVVGGNGAKFYITGTDEYTKYLVNGLSRYTSIQGCNISMDRYFTSVFLAEWALQKKFTIVGTMRHDRKSIPKEVKAIGNRKENSVLHVYHKEKNIMLASYKKEKIRKKECQLPFDNAGQRESDKRPKKEAPDPEHVRSRERRR